MQWLPRGENNLDKFDYFAEITTYISSENYPRDQKLQSAIRP